MKLIIYLLGYLALEALFPSEPHEFKKQSQRTKDLFILDEFIGLFK